MDEVIGWIGVVLGAVGLGSAVYGGVVWARVRGSGRWSVASRAFGAWGGGGEGGVSVAASGAGRGRLVLVAPAHNEADRIGPLVRSLGAAEWAGEALFVLSLDRCTDGTAGVVREIVAGFEARVRSRFVIEEVGSCGEGWSGKVHAVHRGLLAAGERARSADVLVFTDADVWMAPGLLRTAARRLEEGGLDLLSLMPTLDQRAWWEKTVQPVAGMELVRRFPLDRLNEEGHRSSGIGPRGGERDAIDSAAGSSPDPSFASFAAPPHSSCSASPASREGSGVRFANGQFMMFRGATYWAMGGGEGGHADERVRGAVLEDLALARRVRRPDIDGRLGVLMAGEMLRCRMYEDWSGFRRGWKRIYTESAHGKASALRRWSWRVAGTGVVLPVCSALSALVGSAGLAAWGPGAWSLWAVCAGAAGLLGWGASGWVVYGAQRADRRWLVAQPIGAWLVSRVLAEAARDKRRGVGTRWGGMVYGGRDE